MLPDKKNREIYFLKRHKIADFVEMKKRNTALFLSVIKFMLLQEKRTRDLSYSFVEQKFSDFLGKPISLRNQRQPSFLAESEAAARAFRSFTLVLKYLGFMNGLAGCINYTIFCAT